MVKIFVEDISSIRTEEQFKQVFSLLPKYRQNKILRFKFDKDRYLSLLAGKLLHDGLIEVGFEKYDSKIEEDENGKPYIPGNPIHFSISHSGTKAMVVISDCEVGCDIQYMKEDALPLADSFFSENECKEIKNSNNQIVSFYKMWTLKESFMKVTGKGLSLGLKNINVEKCRINNDGFSSFFYDVGEEYISSYILKDKNA